MPRATKRGIPPLASASEDAWGAGHWNSHPSLAQFEFSAKLDGFGCDKFESR
jgi:hypothetical protein